MENYYFRQLSTEEEKEFRQWARNNYTPGDDIKSFYHPVVRQECETMNVEELQKLEYVEELQKLEYVEE
jgi:hypothetical protein